VATPVRNRGLLERLEELVSERLTGQRGETASSSFLRGLAVGALVGAAIAGSTIWERRRASRAQPEEQSREPEAPLPDA
jgi:hypothetical protein